MHSADVALRFSAVFAVAGFIIMAASFFEIDRREKSSSETVTANFTEIEQRVQCSVRKFVFSMINIQVRSTGMSNSFTRSILKFKRLTRD